MVYQMTHQINKDANNKTPQNPNQQEEVLDEQQEIVDEEISIGDYVLTGGEIPAMAVIDFVGVMRSDSERVMPMVLSALRKDRSGF